MKNLIFVFLSVVLFSTFSCSHDSDDLPPIIDTIPLTIPIWDTVYADAEYIDVSRYDPWNDGTHFDTTVVYNGTDRILMELFGFPVLFPQKFPSEMPEVEFRLKGGYLLGERDGPLFIPPMLLPGTPEEGHEIYWDTIHVRKTWYPNYVITQLGSEGNITLDTIILPYSEDLYDLHLTQENTPAWHFSYEQLLLNYPEGISQDKLLFTNDFWEVYFVDLYPFDHTDIGSTEFTLAVIPKIMTTK